MTTKEQERKALEKIRGILAGLGDDSYIGTALEGCLEIAEQNIDLDTAFSMKGERDLAEKQVRELKQVRDDLVEENRHLQARAEKAETIANAKIESADRWCAKYHDKHEELARALTDITARDATIDALEREIVTLKAKLYDLMIAGA